METDNSMNQSELEANEVAPAKRVRASHDWFWFYFWLVEKVARDFFSHSQSVAMQNQSNRVIYFYAQLKIALIFSKLQLLL